MITYISCLMLIISNGWNKSNGWKILEKLISGWGGRLCGTQEYRKQQNGYYS